MRHVAVIGGTMVDILATYINSSNHGSCALASHEIVVGGVGLNMARILKKLGNDLEMVCVLGADAFADLVLSELTLKEINTSVVCKLQDQKTALYVGLHEKNGEVSESAASKIIYQKFSFANFTKEQLAILANQEAWVLDSSFDSSVYKGLAELPSITERKIYMTICGPDEVKNIQPILSKLSALFCNAEEIESLAKLLRPDLASRKIDIRNAIEVVWNVGKVNNIFVTNGKEDLSVCHDNKLRRYSVPLAEVKCVNGGGDAFAAGAIDALINKLDIDTVVTSGLCCAKLQIEGRGDEIRSVFSAPRVTYS